MSAPSHVPSHTAPQAAGHADAPAQDLTLALWQTPYAPDVPGALRALDDAAVQARARGADVLVCPEMSLTGYLLGADRIAALAEPAEGPLLQAVAATARRHQLAIVCGWPCATAGRPHNAAAFIAADGTRLNTCAKTHLFGDADRVIILSLQGLALGCLLLAGSHFELGGWFHLGLLAAAGCFVWEFWYTRDRDPQRCFKAFLHNHWAGLAIFVGIVLNYAVA